MGDELTDRVSQYLTRETAAMLLLAAVALPGAALTVLKIASGTPPGREMTGWTTFETKLLLVSVTAAMVLIVYGDLIRPYLLDSEVDDGT